MTRTVRDECEQRITILTLVQARVPFLLDNAVKGLEGSLLLATGACDMHLALDGNVRVGNRRGKELAKSAQEEDRRRGDLALLLLHNILHLFEQRVLKNGVNHENQGGKYTGEEGLGALVLQERQQRSDCAWGLGLRDLGTGAGLDIGGFPLLSGGDPGVDDPDGVGDDDSR